jgi:hypothetical protein
MGWAAGFSPEKLETGHPVILFDWPMEKLETLTH